jgi:hypothetical protein
MLFEYYMLYFIRNRNIITIPYNELHFYNNIEFLETYDIIENHSSISLSNEPLEFIDNYF